MNKIRAHLIIKGRVQGVCFRMETMRAALQQGNLTGWVRNLADGTVAAVFEGAEPDVKSMVDWCGRGPAGALVTDVQVSWEEYTGAYNSFEIRY
ncbi:MAG: acylphosphatase [Pseudomonadota bacterium]